MARLSLESFTHGKPTRTSKQDIVSAEYFNFNDQGEIIFQINTFGKDSRQIKGKSSQSIQIDKACAEFLINQLKTIFNL